jgi:anti-anti-sigma factor
MDSTGIQLLISAHARSRTNEHHLLLRPGSAVVQRVITLCGVADRLPVADQIDQDPG